MRLPRADRADDETALLIDVLRRDGRISGRNVLDVCSGSGALAVTAAQAGAASVTAVDLSRRCAASAWANTRMCRAPVDVLCGDLLEPVRGRRFDVVLANPPCVPTERVRHRKAHAGDAGSDGRRVLDRLIRGLPEVLAHDGRVLIVHSDICGVRATLDAMGAQRMDAQVVARVTAPFGRSMRDEAPGLVPRGLIATGQRGSDAVVIEGRLATRHRVPPRTRVDITGEGPVLVYGTVDVTTPDGSVVRSRRGVTALCTCKRSGIFPFCDSSHHDRKAGNGSGEGDS